MATEEPPSALPTYSWDLTEHNDKILEEIHAWRAKYAQQFDYDLNRMFASIARNPPTA